METCRTSVGAVSCCDTWMCTSKCRLKRMGATTAVDVVVEHAVAEGKSAEEVYSKFVQGYLLEEGAPMMILTDRGKEFDNVLLKELMRLLRVRLHFTPAYHPRGNYTERVNRFIGTSLRTMLAMPGARQADWWKLTKFVQFAYRRAAPKSASFGI